MSIVNWGSLKHPYVTDAAPSNGASGTFAGHAPIGARLIDNVTGLQYVNTGTQASPTWSPTVTTVGANIDDGAVKVVGTNPVLGGIPVLFPFTIAAGALADQDITVTHKIRVIDAWVVLRGAGVANTTFQVKNGSTAITDAMAASGSDTALVRAAVLDDAAYEVAAGGTLRVTSATGATQPSATVYVLAMRVS
jgi:hypothetical protein